jgi:ERCC4-related helicase
MGMMEDIFEQLLPAVVRSKLFDGGTIERFDGELWAELPRQTRLLDTLHRMVKKKAQKAGEARPCKGMVFAKTKHGVRAILRLLRRHDDLAKVFRPRPFVGQSGRAGALKMSRPEQERMVRCFHARSSGTEDWTDLLVSTSIGEEGLDFPSCCFVLRYDGCDSDIALTQSLGRIRTDGGNCFIMIRGFGESSEWKRYDAATK